MAKASDNVFPRLLISEGGSTTTPAAGNVTVYAKADGLLYSKDDAGAETLVSGGSGGAGSGEFTEIDKATVNGGNLTTGSTTFIDATGLTVTQTTAAVRCLVIFNAVATISAAGQVDVDLDIDGTRVMVGNSHGLKFFGASASNQHGDISFTYVTDVLTAASHTFKIVWRTTIGTGTLYGNTTHSPAILTVLETSQTT